MVDGDVLIRDASRRNLNALVRAAGRSYFVKRTGDSRREAEHYALLATVPGLAEAIPTVVRADLDGRLVLAVEDGAVDLVDHHEAAGTVAPEIGGAVGRALAALHRGTRLAISSSAPDEAPPIVSVHRPTVGSLEELTPAAIELTRIVQGQASLCAALDDLRSGWRRESLIHDDVKWANIVVVPARGLGRPGIRLVDWEHAREGEPAWDLGSAFAGYVTAWIDSIPDQASLAGEAASARSPLHGMRGSIRALWDAYFDGAGLQRREADALRRRAVAFGGARLIRTALEEAMVRPAMSRRGFRLLQVAANVVEDADAAAGSLLGLPAG